MHGFGRGGDRPLHYATTPRGSGRETPSDQAIASKRDTKP